MPTPEIYELWRLENVAFDIAGNFGNTGDVAVARMTRLVNRAMIKIAGNNRRWTWLRTKDSFTTVANVREYSLRLDAKEITKFWMEGSNRGEIIRVPEGFDEDGAITSGSPSLFDWRGVDSNGAKVVEFYPLPGAGIEIFYRFYRHITPVKDGGVDLRSAWGIPPNICELLIEVATALAWQGINDKRFYEQVNMATTMIQDAYDADQENIATRYRQKSQESDDRDDGPRFEPRFGY